MNTELEQKIGQMLLIGFRGLELQDNNPIIEDVRARHLGGVVLFDYDVGTQTPVRNIHSPDQVQRLAASLQNLASEPLFIGIDQEGGKVNRLKERYGFPPSVSARHLGEINQLGVTRTYAELTAKTLAAMGINLNFAPAVDLNLYPENPIIGKVERSFSADPDVVIRHARQWIACHHEQRVLCTLKHFPGHGSSRQDTHLGFVDVTDTWSAEELRPYHELLRSGFSDMVMTAHIFNTRLDPEFPATLSPKIITGILREQFGYDGVIISDDMQMKAIASQYAFETAIQSALEAGVDILTFGNNLSYNGNIMTRVVAIISQLVRQGTLSEKRIDKSYQRILRLKARL